jgi:hypothetical protein
VDKPWTTPTDVEAQLGKLWLRGRLLAAKLGSDPGLFPLPLRLNRPDSRALADRFDDVRRWIRSLEEGSRTVRGFGYEITWDEINHRQLGRNRVPVGLAVPSEEDALALIGKRRQADRFARMAASALGSFPALGPWLGKRPHAALDCGDDWERVLAVLTWLRDRPRPGIYLRQLDIPGVDTKFIEARKGLLAELLDIVLPPDAVDRAAAGARQFERRYGLLSKPPLVRFRFLDPAHRLGPLTDVSTPASDFARLAPPAHHVFITENEINGLAFPAREDSLVIFGLGYGLDRLARIEWLRDRTIHYWGDIDTHGFAILDRLRTALPSVRSFLMDRETLLAHRSLWTHEETGHSGPLAHLTEAEAALYRDIVADGLGTGVRLEQERVAFGWVEQALRRV